MYVHVFSQATKHHVRPLLVFFRDTVLPLTRKEEHIFVCCGEETNDDENWPTGVNLVFTSGVSSTRALLKRHLRQKDRLIFHGLYDRALVVALFTILRRTDNATWIIWGSDLYPFLKPYPLLPHQAANMWLRRSVFRRMARIAGIPGDYSILEKDLGLSWPHSPVSHPLRLEQSEYAALLEKAQANRNKELTVLLGNSASATNRHEDALEMLSRFKNDGLRLILPLNYAGQRGYVDEIKQQARRLFDDKVTLLDQLLTTEDYLELLTGIDVLVFNHKRQEGIGTINAALMLGKKVFLHHDVSTYAQLSAGGVELHDTSTIRSIDFATFRRWSADSGARNHHAVYAIYGQEAVAKLYLEMLRSIDSGQTGRD